MAKARVMVVDDAVVFRKLLSDEIAADAELEATATAANGQLALDRLAKTSVDIVVLDVEMPVMDGLATLKELRKLYPRLPVIMFSTLTERGASATLDALMLGANDYFPKPATTSMEASLTVVRENLIPKMKALLERERTRAAGLIKPTTLAPPTTRPHAAPIQLLVIGSSTGGPNALVELFAGLPADLPVPIAVTQHMPPMFTRMLAEQLSNRSSLRVTEAVDGQPLLPGQVVVAPGDFHLEVVKGVAGKFVAKLHQGPHENSCRPAVDALFRSAAAAGGAGVLAVVLTGMGSDGCRGAEALKAVGAKTIVQDEASAVVWGMPGAVVRAGLADGVFPLNQLASVIGRRIRPAGVVSKP